MIPHPIFPCVVVVASLFALPGHVVADVFGMAGNTFKLDFVTIGNPGNAPDTSGRPNPCGAVDYVYRMGKFEVSREMVAKASFEGDLEITLDPLENVAGGSRPDMPATGVSWNEAARFVNWLNTSEGYAPAYKFSKQPGETGYDANANILLWEAGDPGFDSDNPFRNRRARYVLPTWDEWYKAAYYDPKANGGAGAYWDFPTGSDSEPIAVDGGIGPNTAVYHSQLLLQGPADVSQSGGLSPYGVMGLGGNAWEWQESEFDLVNDDGSSVRSTWGGSWNDTALWMQASTSREFFTLFDFLFVPSDGRDEIGFRVASVPEPTTLPVGLLGVLGLRMRRRLAA